jgi:4,5-dihydroxyphthalate decarboxylase
MGDISLTLAMWDYDRTRALADGRVKPDGIALTCLSLPVEETFFRMARHREFEVAEMSLSSYLLTLNRPEPPFIAIPVFPSRFFRHSCIYLHEGSGIKSPKDLIGKKVGTPEYQMTAPVWIRGILEDEYGVPADSVSYFTGGEESPGRTEKLKLDLPPNIHVTPIGPGKTLARMLAEGEIDALYTARAPSTFAPGGPVKRLFPDFAAVERAYFQKTGIFPIMHVVVIRRDIYRAHPWVAGSLYKAFCRAQAITYDDLHETAALKAMLPWLMAHLADTEALMGRDYWSYGLAGNENTLSTFARYSHAQGLAAKRHPPADLFAPETLESFVI